MLSRDTFGQLFGMPTAPDTCCPRGSVVQHVTFVAIVHNLLVVHNLPDVGPVIVDTHVAHQEHLPVLDETGKRAEHLVAMGNVSDPIAVLALDRQRGVQRPTTDYLEPVLAFKHRLHPVIGLGRYHHSVFRRSRQLLAPGRRATRNNGPRAIIANHRRAVRREFVILLARDQQSLTVLDHGHVVDVVPVVACHRDVAVLYLRDHARGETLRHRVTPFSVDLTDRRGISLEFHVIVAPENYARTKAGTCWNARVKRSVWRIFERLFF